MGEFVGITERNTRRFFQIIRRLAPCIVVGDEIGQQMGGGQPGQPGHQVDARMLGTFLTNMSEIQEPVFWFFTANDISSMHEAFARAERVDAKVYVRLPGPDQLAQVWKIYIKKFFPETIKGQPNPRYVSLDLDAHVKAIKSPSNKDPDVQSLIRAEAAAMLMTLPVAERKKALLTISVSAIDPRVGLAIQEMLVKDDRWTPAEVRACCRLALRLKLPLHLAARRVGHVCIGPKGDKLLAALDEWAVNDGAIDSETGEVFKPEQKSDAKRRRVRSDDPESN